MSARPLPLPSLERRAQLGLGPRPPARRSGREVFDDLPLGALLGEGAGSRVYLSRLGPGRPVAAKVLREVAPPGSVAALAREGEILARLDHPAVPALAATGFAGGRPALAISYVRGVTLSAALGTLRDPRGGRPGLASRMLLTGALLSVARGLQHAHGRRYVHLDLKPANVMVRPDGSGVLIDWGLAHRDEGRIVGLRPRRSDTVAGTPGYMAPEQVRGERPAAAADQFALGLLLFEALTLRPAVLGWSPRERMQRTLDEVPPDPRLIAPTGWVSARLANLVLRAVQPRPTDRFDSVKDLADELEIALLELRRGAA